MTAVTPMTAIENCLRAMTAVTRMTAIENGARKRAANDGDDGNRVASRRSPSPALPPFVKFARTRLVASFAPACTKDQSVTGQIAA
jgi:hypothetical protein